MSLSELLAKLAEDDSDSSSDSDDENTGGIVGLLTMAAAANLAAGETGDDPVAKALAGLIVLKSLESVLDDASTNIRVGDMIRIEKDEATIRGLQDGHGGWTAKMSEDLHKIGVVVKKVGDDPVVHFGQQTWRLNEDTCVKVSKDEKKQMFSFGDQVYVEFPDNIAKEMQKAHGGWNSLMGGDLSKIGRVMGCDDDGDIAVQFWARSWRLNSAACKILTTESGCTIQEGDTVFMDNDVDIEVLRAMLEGHGGWNPNIVDELGRIGKVLKVDSDGDVEVKLGKRKWFLNPLVLTKITSMVTPGGDFYAIGDEVSIGLPMDVLKDMQKEHGEWADGITQDIGKKGKVIGILAKGDIHVEFGKNKWRLNAAVLTKHTTGKQIPFKVGQRIAIDYDAETFLKLQIGHGGINTSMLTDLGKVGKILEIYPDKDLTVQFTPNVWSLNPAICTKLSDTVKEKFSVGDRAFIALDSDIVKALQDGHGGFTDTMYRLLGQIGRVCKILPQGDILVLYGILPLVLNPSTACAFTPLDFGEKSSSRAGSRTSFFSSGDLVSVDMDLDSVKRCQDGHGGWKPEMQPLLGRVGIVQSVHSSGDLVVCYGDVSARFNPAVCSVVKSDNIQDNQEGVTSTDDDTHAAADAQDDKQRMECPMCHDTDIATVFGCGHGTCDSCGKTLTECPTCRAQISFKTSIYF